jgi:hypothetical protein
MGIDLNLPIILNFGDFHVGRDGCNEMGYNEMGSVDIDSYEFLGLLDELGKYNNIDLYLEFFGQKTENMDMSIFLDRIIVIL